MLLAELSDISNSPYRYKLKDFKPGTICLWLFCSTFDVGRSGLDEIWMKFGMALLLYNYLHTAAVKRFILGQP